VQNLPRGSMQSAFTMRVSHTKFDGTISTCALPLIWSVGTTYVRAATHQPDVIFGRIYALSVVDRVDEVALELLRRSEKPGLHKVNHHVVFLQVVLERRSGEHDTTNCLDLAHRTRHT